MTSLRERIEAKKRRTASFPLQLGDAAAAAAEVQVRRGALDLHQRQVAERTDRDGGQPTEAEAKRTIVLRGALREATERREETVVDVELQSLEDSVWDEVLSHAGEDENGDIDLDDVRAELLAASCTDESLRDADWWTEQLAKPSFSKGDKLAINNLLMSLNLNTPAGRQGKG